MEVSFPGVMYKWDGVAVNLEANVLRAYWSAMRYVRLRVMQSVKKLKILVLFRDSKQAKKQGINVAAMMSFPSPDDAYIIVLVVRVVNYIWLLRNISALLLRNKNDESS